MFQFKQLTVTNKLTLLAMIAVLGLGVFGTFSFLTVQRVKVTGPLYTHIAQGDDLLADVVPARGYIVESYVLVLQMVTEEDSVRREAISRDIDELRKEYDQRHAAWTRELDDGELKQWLTTRSYQPAQKFFRVVEDQVIPALRAGEQKSAFDLAHNKLQVLFEEHRAAIDEVVLLTHARNAEDEQLAQSTVSFSNWLLIATGASIGGIILVLAYLINSSIRSTLEKVERVAKSVSHVSHSMSETASQLSLNTHKQAAGLEQSAASLEQIAATVDQNTESAEQANELALRSRTSAEAGGRVVHSAIEAMIDIEAASRRIADIITTIDEIAFQTNLLALNAAVEAARAGEQGRGFAVVAGEVRTLAQRSASAAREIKELIGDSVEKVTAGSGLVNQSGEKLNEIVYSVNKVTELVGEIATASHEQSSAMEQITRAVSQIDHATQRTASQADSVSRGAVGLAEQSQQLEAVLTRLHVTEASRGRDGARSRHERDGELIDAITRSDRELDAIPVGAGSSHDGFEEF